MGTLFGCNLAAFVRLAHSMACCFHSWCNSVACVQPCSLQGSLLLAVQSTTDVVTILGNGNMMETSGVFADIEYASGLRVFRIAQHVRETPQYRFCGIEHNPFTIKIHDEAKFAMFTREFCVHLVDSCDFL